MSNVNTDAVSLSLTPEVVGSLGVLPATPIWALLEPNTITAFGPTIKTTPRTPISKNLQRSKGKVTDLDSGVTIQHDLTMEFLSFILPYALFSKYSGPGGLADGEVYYPTAVTATGYTVAADGDLPEGTLIYASGFAVAANNGFKVVGAGSTGTEIKTSGLAVEVTDQPSQNAKVEVCGVQGVAGDFRIDADGNITSEVAGLDFTTLGLSEGQFIWVGGDDTATRFATAADRGFARITKGGIAAHKLTVDKKATTWTVDAGALKTIQIFFGRWISNVAKDHAKYLFQSLQAELTWPDLDSVGVDEYSYAKGNFVDQFQLELPIANKGGITLTMIGTDTDPPTTSRDPEADEARQPVQIDSFNTSSEIVRLRATEQDETGITTDFLSATLAIKNNVSGKKVLGFLGSKYINRGYIEPDLDSDLLFTDDTVLAIVRSNETVTTEGCFRNADAGGFAFDMPSVTGGDGSPSFPEHDQVSVKVTFAGFRDTTYGYSISFSLFPYLPLPE